jgi:Fe-S-cluster containining protein
MNETCGGFCCERFRVRVIGGSDESMSPERIQEFAAIAKERGEDPQMFQQVADMVIYLGKSKLNGNGEVTENESHWYTCKNHDKATGLCKIYEQRPPMCRNFDPANCDFHKCRLHKQALATQVLKYAGETREKEFL